ncbi:MAG: hypothetical protein Q4A72_05390 [Bacillota bacterium]|nr:hypothetical protein [Bacillota bacterium]
MNRKAFHLIGIQTGTIVTDSVSEFDWQKLEAELFGKIGKIVRLKIDSYRVDLTVIREEMTLKIMVILNEKFLNGELKKDEKEISFYQNELRKRFLWKKSRHLLTESRELNLLEIRDLKKLPEKGMEYAPYFLSFETLRRTFERNNKEIEWA